MLSVGGPGEVAVGRRRRRLREGVQVCDAEATRAELSALAPSPLMGIFWLMPAVAPSVTYVPLAWLAFEVGHSARSPALTFVFFQRPSFASGVE